MCVIEWLGVYLHQGSLECSVMLADPRGVTVVRNKKATRAPKKKPPPPQSTMGQRSFEFIQNEQPKLNRNEADNIVSSVNRALHREGISNVGVGRIRCTDSRRLLGVTTSTSTLQDLLEHRDTVPRAARLVNSCITGLIPQQRWKWIRIHNISLTRYMGKARDGGLVKLREEFEAENGGVHILAEIRWLGRAKVRVHFQEKKDGTSSVVAAVLGEATFRRFCEGVDAAGGEPGCRWSWTTAWRPHR